MTLLELYRYAEGRGIPVDAFPLGRTEALSLLDGEGGCHIAIDPFRVKSAADEKTKLGHELGHCMTGAFYTVASPCDVRARHGRSSCSSGARRSKRPSPPDTPRSGISQICSA